MTPEQEARIEDAKQRLRCDEQEAVQRLRAHFTDFEIRGAIARKVMEDLAETKGAM